MIREISRTAVDSYLRIVRLPVEAVLNRRGREQSEAVSLRLDRADAMARGVAATALRDDELKENVERRRDAIDERERALRLREVAEEHSQRAEADASEAREEAARKRREATRAAERQKQQAAENERRKKQAAASKAGKRKAKAEAEASSEKAEAESRNKREKLRQLKVEEAALAKKQEALTAADETKRLKKQTAKAKAERKAAAR